MTASPALTGAPPRTRTENTSWTTNSSSPSTSSTKPLDRIQEQQYGITRIPFHNHGDIALTTVHDYTPRPGTTWFCSPSTTTAKWSPIEATAPDLNTEPRHPHPQSPRRGAHLPRRPRQPWTYRAAHAGHTYTLTAGIGDQPTWTVTVDDRTPKHYDDLDDALSTVLDHHAAHAA